MNGFYPSENSNFKFNTALGDGKLGKLALSLILYNEGKTIARVIESFHYNGVPVYDMLLVGIDNKTDDNTLEEVKKYCHPDNIFFFDFNNDFGGSRNIALEKLYEEKVDWIIMPDGHEILADGSLEYIKWVVDGGVDSQGVNLISAYIEMEPNEDGESELVFPRPLFLRNKKGIYFQRKVHNYLDAPAHEKAVMPEIRFEHRMPPDRQIKRKAQRKDMNIAELEKNAESGDVRDLYYLGNTCAEASSGCGPEEKERLITKAIDCFERSIAICNGADFDMAAQIAVNLSSIYLSRDAYKDCKRICFIGMANRWDRAELYCNLAIQAVARAKEGYEKGAKEWVILMKQARHWFGVAADMEIPVTVYFVQRKYYTYLPYDGLMDVRNNLGDLEGSLAAAKRVLGYKPDNQIMKDNIKALEEAIANRIGSGERDDAESKFHANMVASGAAKNIDPFI